MGAVFHIYLKSRFSLKVIIETTRISSVIRISSVYSHEIQLLGQFLSVVTRAGMHADRNRPYLLSKGSY